MAPHGGIPQLPRARAEQLLTRAIERVQTINANPGFYAHRVMRLAVFGSYLRDLRAISELDLGIELIYLRDPRLDSAALIHHWKSHTGRCIAYLRQRCTLIHLHDMRLLEERSYPYRLIFTVDDGLKGDIRSAYALNARRQ
jgi:hypothetical protein